MEKYDYIIVDFKMSEFNTAFDIVLNFRDNLNKDAINYFHSIAYFITEDRFSRPEDDHTKFLRKTYNL